MNRFTLRILAVGCLLSSRAVCAQAPADVGSALPMPEAAASQSPSCAQMFKRQGMFAGMLPIMQFACETLDSSAERETAAAFKDYWRRTGACYAANPADHLARVQRAVSARVKAAVGSAHAEAIADCKQSRHSRLAFFTPPRVQFASPEATWNEFKAALRAHDKGRALRCFDNDRSSEVIEALNAAQMEEMAGRFGAVARLAGEKSEDFMQLAIEPPHPDGKTVVGVVVFSHANGNWFISTL